jgi:hypothetical protein
MGGKFSVLLDISDVGELSWDEGYERCKWSVKMSVLLKMQIQWQIVRVAKDAKDVQRCEWWVVREVTEAQILTKKGPIYVIVDKLRNNADCTAQ